MLSSVIAAVLVGLAANLDNAGTGLSYGVRRIRIPALPNLNIAAIAVVGALAFALAGARIAQVLTPELSAIIGASILILIGIYVMLPSLLPKTRARALLESPELADVNGDRVLSFRESWVLGVALGINAWSGGLGGGLMGLSPWLVALTVGSFSYVMLDLPSRLGQRVGARLGIHGPIIAGILLILVGLHQLM